MSPTHVERLIKVHIGADKRIVQKYMRMLIEDLGFLKVLTKNPFGVCIYKIGVETVEQYISEHMKERLRQLTLLDLWLREEEVAEKSLVCVQRDRREINAYEKGRIHRDWSVERLLSSIKNKQVP